MAEGYNTPQVAPGSLWPPLEAEEAVEFVSSDVATDLGDTPHHDGPSCLGTILSLHLPHGGEGSAVVLVRNDPLKSLVLARQRGGRRQIMVVRTPVPTAR